MNEDEDKKNRREESKRIIDKWTKFLADVDDAKKREDELFNMVMGNFDSISDPLEKAAKAKELISVADGYLAKYRDRLPLRIKEALIQRQYDLSKIL